MLCRRGKAAGAGEGKQEMARQTQSPLRGTRGTFLCWGTPTDFQKAEVTRSFHPHREGK